MNKKKILICLCVFCLLFIFFNSSQVSTVSNARSKEIVNEIVSVISKTQLGQAALNHISLIDLNLLIRKIAHAFEYFLMALAICITLDYYKIEDKNIIIYSLFIIILIATFDEFFQLFIQDRNSNVKDVLIDFSGGIIANILYFIFSTPRGRHIERKYYGSIRNKKSQ